MKWNTVPTAWQNASAIIPCPTFLSNKQSMRLMKLTLSILILLGLFAGPTKGDDSQPRNIALTKIEGRHWLVGPDGEPFFAHGITHVSNNRAKFDFGEISNACKKLGFNAYGYGCPFQLRSDMPYVESWNHLVPISTYRGKDGIKFVDIFDPEAAGKA